jgi:hypothetical protein
MPVIEYYRSRGGFGSVDGLQSAEKVTSAICAHIDGVRPRSSGA